MRSLRPNYPYSVIPGGAYSKAELWSRLRKDPLAATHYSDFNVDVVRLVASSHEQLAYVSYRLNNRILWTRRKLRIPKGELLLTDGKNLARARCGNRVSEVASEQVLPDDAPPGLDAPAFSMKLFQTGSVPPGPAPEPSSVAPQPLFATWNPHSGFSEQPLYLRHAANFSGSRLASNGQLNGGSQPANSVPDGFSSDEKPAFSTERIATVTETPEPGSLPVVGSVLIAAWLFLRRGRARVTSAPPEARH